MSKKLRKAYDTISRDYLRKKQNAWRDFMQFISDIDLDCSSVVIDLGAGNGRNLHACPSSLPIALDLSYELLRGYVGPEHGQTIAGAFPSLPFRKNSTSTVFCIAVLHHFREPDQAVKALQEIARISVNADIIISVWRRWRTGYKEKLYSAIRNNEPVEPLINHERPWYNSEREVMTTRFYHYYSFRELYHQIENSGLSIVEREYLGGRNDDANIFVKLTNSPKTHYNE